MTGPVKATDPARLDELAAVTSEYARYSHERLGVAYVVAGAALVAGFGLAMRSETWGRIAGFWTPVLVFVGILAARHYYQRLGYVEEATPRAPTRLRRATEWFGAIIAARVVTAAPLQFDAWTERDLAAKIAMLGALATVPFLFPLSARFRGGRSDDTVALLSLLSMGVSAAFTDSALGWVIAKIFLGLLAAFGVCLVPVGAYQHVQYRRLERRLAALKGGAP